MSFAKNNKQQDRPVLLIDGYEVDFQKSEEENLKLYIKHGYARFWAMWFNKPLKDWWKTFEEGVNALFDVYDRRRVDGPEFLLPFFLVIHFVIILVYFVIFYLPVVTVYLIIWLFKRNAMEKKAKLEISIFLESIPVKIEIELLNSERELKRIIAIRNEGNKDYMAYMDAIESNNSQYLNRKYGVVIDNFASRYEDNLRLFHLMIEQIEGNVKEIKIWKTLEKAEKDFKKYGNQLYSYDITDRHAFFISRLEEMKKDRTLAEEIEIFDLTEGLKLKLEVLEGRKNQMLLYQTN